jgi:AGCS family alanine or glycine:cation symporter
MHSFFSWMDSFTNFLWGGPMLLLLAGTHIYFTVRLGFIQKYLPRGIRLSFSRSDSEGEGVSPYAALSTALAATIGTGNIIGISTAIAIGGPGAVFWCWLTGLLGIATCYGECFLSVSWRVKNKDGHFMGGPMYVLQNGLRKKWLAFLFSLAAVLASFGMGSSVQSHSICSALQSHMAVSPHIIGMAAALLAGFVMLGGVRQISSLCTFLVPFMSLFYLAGCFYLLFANRSFLPDAFSLIIRSAFSGKAFAGGFTGTAVMLGIRTGISRGLFTNEAGLGSIPMAAACARTPSPVTQGLISMTGPFWDTVVICAVTGLVIVSSILKTPQAYAGIPIDSLCLAAFSQLPFWGTEILSISLILFAFATILGWCYYGECAVRFLAGQRAVKPYQVLYLLSVYLGAVVSLERVWGVSDLLNACMALPNLVCLWLLRKKIITETHRELNRRG